MEINMQKALYERVIIEILEENEDTTSAIKIEDPHALIKVKILDWGTDVQGNGFPIPVNSIGYVKPGANLTKLQDGRYLMDRRLILGTD